MKTLGIAAHSAEGGALCFITACREGAAVLGPHMHPPIVVSAVPMGLSMPGWESGDASFERAIDDLRSDGAECVILGCTEIPAGRGVARRRAAGAWTAAGRETARRRL